MASRNAAIASSSRPCACKAAPRLFRLGAWLGPEFDRALEGEDRLVQTSLCPEGLPQKVVCLGMLRVELRHVLEAGDCRVPLPRSPVDLAQVAVIGGDRGSMAIARPISSIASLAVARLAGQDTQQVQRVGMIGARARTWR